MPISTFCGGRVYKQWQTFLSLSEFGCGWKEFSSRRSEFACIWRSKREGIMMIKIEKMRSHFSSNVFSAISCRGILNSLIFMKARSMQAWIPVVSSSLYFWKSVFKIPLHTFLCFSFWVYSILKWVAYIKLKVSWLHAFLWCMSQTSHDQDNSRDVQTHKKNSGVTVCKFNSIIQSIFVPNHLEMGVWWVRVPRGSSTRAWKLLLHLFSWPDWQPLGLRGWAKTCTGQFYIDIESLMSKPANFTCGRIFVHDNLYLLAASIFSKFQQFLLERCRDLLWLIYTEFE